MAMSRVSKPMFRYGEKDFDEDYLKWGLHNEETQNVEAQSLLRIFDREPPASILDIACGIGIHCVNFARAGYAVTGVDISETFVNKGRELAQDTGAAVEFLVQDINTLPFTDAFDLVTWVEQSFYDESVLQVIYRCLKQGGRLIFDTRNPENPKLKSRRSDWRTWSERDGVFELERHETDQATGIHEDVWIVIDTVNETIEEKHAAAKSLSFADSLDLLQRVGFGHIEQRTMEGDVFTGGEEPYWLWVVAAK